MPLSLGALGEIDVSDRPLKLFISYAHDSREHDARVLELANRLRADGFDCDLDQFQSSPPEGWPKWMDRNLAESDFVLIVVTKRWHDRCMGTATPRRRPRWTPTVYRRRSGAAVVRSWSGAGFAPARRRVNDFRALEDEIQRRAEEEGPYACKRQHDPLRELLKSSDESRGRRLGSGFEACSESHSCGGLNSEELGFVRRHRDSGKTSDPIGIPSGRTFEEDCQSKDRKCQN